MKFTRTKSRILGAFMTVACILCFAFGLSACNRTLALLGWENESVTVMLGERYDVPQLHAADKDGNTYPVSVEVVKRSDGTQVPLIDNAFDVFDIGGYEVRYTATSERASAVKTISVSAEDGGDPIVTFNGGNVAEVDRRYTFPAIDLYDDSGTIASTVIEVYDASGKKVACDDDGFTPTEVGGYELRVTAKDGAGNEGSNTFAIYARRAVAVNEIDAFDDEGLAYTAYSKGVADSATQPAVFAAFKKSSYSAGSAMFSSGGGDETQVFLTPRVGADAVEEGYDYISVWFFIAAPQQTNVTVKFNVYEMEVAANTWTEARLTADKVGNYTHWFNRLSNGQMPFMQVENSALPYKILIDDIYAVKQASGGVSGMQTSYDAGDVLTFAANGVKTELSHGGLTETAVSGETLEVSGDYTLYAYTDDRTRAVESYPFTVGSLAASCGSVVVETGSAVQLSAPRLTRDETPISPSAVDWQAIDLLSGERMELDANSFTPRSEALLLYAQATADGETVGTVIAPSVLPAGRIGTLYLFNDKKDLGNCHPTAVSFLEEYEGEQGVIRIAGGEGTWVWLLRGTEYAFPREYYKECDLLVFRVRTSNTFKFRILAENQKDGDVQIEYETVTITNTDGWQDIAFDFAYFYKHWDAFAEHFMIWSDGNEAGSDLYISDIRAVKRVEVVGPYSVMAGEAALADNSSEAFEGMRAECIVQDAATGASIAVTDGKFTAQAGVNYKVSYTAKGSDGMLYMAQYMITCPTDEERNVLYVLDAASDLGDHKQEYVSFLNEYEGEQGVIKIASDGTWDDDWLWLLRGGNIPFVKEYYEGYDTLVLRVRADGAFTFRILAERQKEDDPLIELESRTVTDTGEWQDITLDFAYFYEHWDAFVESITVEKSTGSDLPVHDASEGVGIPWDPAWI